MPYAESIVTRFWAKVRICEHGVACDRCCWEWQGARLAAGGYGAFTITATEGKQVTARAHVVALELHLQSFLSLDLWALHTCDNPPCCNPAHLFAGTHQDNMEDMRRKGRIARGDRHGSRTHPESVRRGEDNGYARLTSAQVIEMRALAATGGFTYPELAQRFHVPWGTVHSAVTGRSWAHLPGAVGPRRHVKPRTKGA